MTAVSRDGGVSQVQLNAGILARRQHDYRRAATHFAKVLPYMSALPRSAKVLPYMSALCVRRQHDYRRAATHFAQALCVCLIRLPYTSALYVCLMCLPQPTRRRRWRWTRATATRPIGSASRRCFLGVSYPPSVSAFCVCLLCLSYMIYVHMYVYWELL